MTVGKVRRDNLTNPLAIKYVLFTEYGRSSKGDPDGVMHLKNHLRGLSDLLTALAQEGLLILFYSKGLGALLRPYPN
jgi:hypothetical protein